MYEEERAPMHHSTVPVAAATSRACSDIPYTYCATGTVGSNEKVAPNKAANNLNWETGKLWTTLSIDSPW